MDHCALTKLEDNQHMTDPNSLKFAIQIVGTQLLSSPKLENAQN